MNAPVLFNDPLGDYPTGNSSNVDTEQRKEQDQARMQGQSSDFFARNSGRQSGGGGIQKYLPGGPPTKKEDPKQEEKKGDGGNGEPNIYQETSKSFNEMKYDYMLVENVGVNAMFNIIGHYSVVKGNYSKYYFHSSAAGTTPSKSQGDVTFKGIASLMVNGNLVSKTHFVYSNGYNVKYPRGFSNLGSVVMQLPSTGTAVINLQFNYHIKFGSAGNNHSATMTIPFNIRTIGLPRE